MTNESAKSTSKLDHVLTELGQLQQFAGAPKDFWALFLAAVQQLTLADKLVLLARKGDEPWRHRMEWPAESLPSSMLTAFLRQLEELATRAVAAGGLMAPLEPKAGPSARSFIIATRLDLPQPEECLLAGLLSEATEANARQAWLALRLVAHLPQSYQTNLAIRQAKADCEKVSAVLDLTLSVSAEKHFLATALAFCNGLATRFTCDRVSLGWQERGYIRLKAISRTEKFERKMAFAQAVEAAMEEAFDQNEEVVWPPPENAPVISHQHERFAEDGKVDHVCSVPLRSNQEPVAVVLCERRSAPFSETELQQMRLGCDLAAVRLADLQQQDRWFGARWAAALHDHLGKLIGPEHTWAKVLAAFSVLLLAVLFFLRVPYRVEGSFVLRSDDLSYLTAPFEGYIDQVLVRPGDAVTAGAPLLKLKTAELQLEEASAFADLSRYQREADKARSAKALADMRISEALADQAAARLEMVRYRIAHATITSPWAGVVVEGDLRERLGAPVKAADVLLKVARIDTLYAEAEVNERDVHELLGKSTGQIAFVSRPRNKFPVRIIAVEQAAMPKNEANVFLVRCALGPQLQPWWRPGMSGVCKFNVEKRTLIWILTHRTVDFLRLKLWW
jgi:biotin carboxyl carrier protein